LPRPNDPLFFHVRMAQPSVRLHRGGEVWAAQRLNRRIGNDGALIIRWNDCRLAIRLLRAAPLASQRVGIVR